MENTNDKQAARTINTSDFCKLVEACRPFGEEGMRAHKHLVAYIDQHCAARAEDARREAAARIENLEQERDLLKAQVHGARKERDALFAAQRTAGGDAVAYRWRAEKHALGVAWEYGDEPAWYAYRGGYILEALGVIGPASAAAQSVEETAAQADGESAAAKRYFDLWPEHRAAPTAQPTPEKENAPSLDRGVVGDAGALTLADRGAGVIHAQVGTSAKDASVAQPTPPDDERAKLIDKALTDAAARLQLLIDRDQHKLLDVLARDLCREARAALRHPPVTHGAGIGAALANGYVSGVANGGPHVGLVTMHYETGADADRAFEAITDLIDAKPASQPTQAGAEPAAAATIEPVSEKAMMEWAAQAGLFPNTIHHWMPALRRYTDAAIAAAREEGREIERDKIKETSWTYWKERAEKVEAAYEAATTLAGETIDARNAEIADLRARLASAGAGEAAAMRGLLIEAIDSCDAAHEFGTDLLMRMFEVLERTGGLSPTWSAAWIEAVKNLAARQDSAAADKGGDHA